MLDYIIEEIYILSDYHTMWCGTYKNFLLLTSFCASRSASASMRYFKMSRAPVRQARWRGVLPSWCKIDNWNKLVIKKYRQQHRHNDEWHKIIYLTTLLNTGNKITSIILVSVDISIRYKDNKDNKIRRIMVVIIIILVIAFKISCNNSAWRKSKRKFIHKNVHAHKHVPPTYLDLRLNIRSSDTKKLYKF